MLIDSISHFFLVPREAHQFPIFPPSLSSNRNVLIPSLYQLAVSHSHNSSISFFFFRDLSSIRESCIHTSFPLYHSSFFLLFACQHPLNRNQTLAVPSNTIFWLFSLTSASLKLPDLIQFL